MTPDKAKLKSPWKGPQGIFGKRQPDPGTTQGYRRVLKSPWDTYLDRNGRVCVCVCVVRPEKSVPLNSSVWGLGLWYLVAGCP